MEVRPFLDELIVDKATDFIKRSAKGDKPFFTYIALSHVHPPEKPHPDFDQTDPTRLGMYADLMAEMDHRIGQIVDCVEEAGIADDTVIVFSSDNATVNVPAFAWGGSNGPFRGDFSTPPTEGSMRTAAMVRWPGIGQWADAYETSRVDLAAETVKNLGSHLKLILPTFEDRDPATIAPGEIREWVAGLQLKPGSVRRYLATFRALLDFAGADPNPARDPSIRLPRQDSVIVEPPSAADVDAIIARTPARWRLPLRVLEQTGMRIGELSSLQWGDVDEASSRFRVKVGKTAAARRWVTVPEGVMAEVAATCPREDRTPVRQVFPGLTGDVAKNVMARACRAAGIAHYHPHDLRHRYASIQIGRGVPVTMVAAQLGHSRKSLTLDTYAHVFLNGE